MGLKTGQAGLNLIRQYEGCRLAAYKCPAGVWTIGYGHTAGVKEGQEISQAQADAYLAADVARYETNVNKYFDKYSWSQNEFDALVSFAFNIGSIDQLTAAGTRDRSTIAEKMLLYDKAAGQALAGLTKRRKAEQELFLKGNSAASAGTRATVRYGSRGDDVAYLQQRLIAKGYSVGKCGADGKFGNDTLVAVKAFQADNGLVIDGIVGSKTWKALG